MIEKLKLIMTKAKDVLMKSKSVIAKGIASAKEEAKKKDPKKEPTVYFDREGNLIQLDRDIDKKKK